MTEQSLGFHDIGGTMLRAGAATFTAFNPVLGRPLETAYVNATPAEIDQAMRLAASAFHQFRRVSPTRRAQLLLQIGGELERSRTALISQAALETGLAEDRLATELTRTVTQLTIFAEVLVDGSWLEIAVDEANAERIPPKPELRRINIPLGPVVVFGASNFPFAYSTIGGDSASALAAGCPVVVKAHPAHPGTAELTAQAVRRAIAALELPAGIFSHLHGAGQTVGSQLVQHPDTAAVGFTGSLQGGRALFDIAAKRPSPIPVFAEMGSTNPIFILPLAAAHRGAAIADMLARSLTTGAGQFCTCPGIIAYVRSEGSDHCIELLRQAIERSTPQTMLHPGILSAYQERITEISQHALQVTTSRTVAEPSRTEARPTLIECELSTFLAQLSLREEVFGPAAVVVGVDSIDALITLAGSLSGQLTATLHGEMEELSEASSLISVLETKVGRLVFNGVPTGLELCHALQHGGPYPAATDARSTSQGPAAIRRFSRPLSYQNAPDVCLPPELIGNTSGTSSYTLNGKPALSPE